MRVNEQDRHEVLLKLTPLKPFPVIDTYNFLDLAVQNGPAVILQHFSTWCSVYR